MRNLRNLDLYRVEHPILGWGDEKNGCFKIRLQGSRLEFVVIASTGHGWEHVSVSTAERCPRWKEMEQIKQLFFEPHEAVMQLHPPENAYVNIHPYCLHLWRPIDQEIPMPPLWMV